MNILIFLLNTVIALLTLGVISLLGFVLYRHFRQKQIKQKIAITNPEGIDQLEKINLGEIDQWIWIRGHNKNNPLLLFIHGGPGKAEMSFMYPHQKLLEEKFTVVHWDQRGAGKSYSKSIPASSINADQVLKDIEQLSKILLKRFNQKKLYLLGHSWGSALGMWAAKRYPELFYAYIGFGQVANFIESQKIGYNFVFEKARQTNNRKALDELNKIGQPPYHGDLKKIRILFNWLLQFGGEVYGKNNYKKSISDMFFFPYYNFVDVFSRWPQGMMFTLKNMIHEVEGIDLFTQVAEVKVPVYFCIGSHDYNTAFSVAEKYFQKLKAPKKKLEWFEKSAHSPMFEEPEKFQNFIINTVLKENPPV